MEFKKSNDFAVKKEKRNKMFKRLFNTGAIAALSIGLAGPTTFYNPTTASAASNVDVVIIDDDGIEEFIDEDFELDNDFNLDDSEIEIDLGEDVDNVNDDDSGNNDETHLDSLESGDPDEIKERAARKKKLELSTGSSGGGGEVDPDEAKEREKKKAALGLDSSTVPTDDELEQVLDEEDLENDIIELDGDGIIIDEDDEGIDIIFDDDIELDDEFID